MTELYLHNRALVSIFELRGDNENDITASIGWALSQSPVFLNALARHILPKVHKPTIHRIMIQHYDDPHGITDVEIIGAEVHCIIEAKRGWNLPGKCQLQKYAARLQKSHSRCRALVVMTECSDEWAWLHLPKFVDGFKLVYLSWGDVLNICSQISIRTHAEKRLLRELCNYLRRVVSMQNQESNWVYVIALSTKIQKWSGMPWCDYVIKNRLFHQEVASSARWPKEGPPNYLGFRYDGKLQSIHHVKKFEIVNNLHGHIPRVRHRGKWMDEPHYLCKLGPPIVPFKKVKTTGLWNTRTWAALDLLLTCRTVLEAVDKTDQRLKE
jgi:hypothetical protein